MFASLGRAYVVYPLCERFEGRSIRAKVAALRTYFSLSYGVRLQRQRETLARVVQRAAVEVPYYRDLFAQINFDPIRLTFDSKWFEDIPFLTKDIVREQGGRMLSERHAGQFRHERKTGGSTGPSAFFFYSPEALDWTAAAHLLAYEWTGKRRHDREIHLSSRFPESFPLRDRLKEWVKCQAMNRVNVATHTFDDDGLNDAWQQIRRVRPGLLQGHPSTMSALAHFVERRFGPQHAVISRFQCTGEVLTNAQRGLLERVFGARVFNSYGNAELGVIAQQVTPAASTGLRVIDAVAWVEADQGEIIATNLTNSLMPLLRYRTGDLADVEEQRDGRCITNIVGRVHDIITIGQNTYPTHYLQDLLDRLGGIEDFQCVQPAAGGPLRINLVVPDEGRHQALRDRVRQWWGEHVELHFVARSELVRVGHRGKYRYLVTEATDSLEPSA